MRAAPIKRVLVTGATGLVGSWLVKELIARGTEVTALVRDSDPQSELFRSGDSRRVSIVNGALEDFWSIERAINEYEIDTVFHLAAQAIVGVSHRFPLQTFESNIRGTYNLLEVCRIHRNHVHRVVVASSDKAYGTHEDLPYYEDMPLQGRHPYEVSKSCADLLAQCYSETYDLPIAIARCGNIFGGGDLNWSRLVPGTVRSLLMGERPIIRSDGSYIRDYLFVRDVVAAYIALAENLERPEIQGQAFNFSLEQRISVLELVDHIRRLTGRMDIEPDVRNTASGEIRDQFLDARKARRLLDWTPSFGMEAGLVETIRWYQAFLDAQGSASCSGPRDTPK